MYCWMCLSDGCGFCGGSGVVAMKSCPSRAYQQAMSAMSGLFKAYRWLEDKAIFPISGGLCDQSAYFMRCVEYIKSYTAMVEHKKRENADKMKSLVGKKVRKGK